jgi:hypothetical protein
MLPPATQGEIEVCLAKLFVDTSSRLVVVLSPTGQVLAWQGTGVYDALIREQASGQGPTLDPNVREHIAPPYAPCAGYCRHPRPFSSCTPLTPLGGNRDASHRGLGKQSPSRAHSMLSLQISVARGSAGQCPDAAASD